MTGRPNEIAIDLAPPSARSSSDFVEVAYPPSHWTAAPTHRNPEEDHLLHYMTDEKARRRAPRGPARSEKEPSIGTKAYYDDDDGDGKDVYAKFSPTYRVSSGRPHRPPPPPAMTIVCLSVRCTTYSAADENASE